MTFSLAAVLGIVEGISEFLPISSTGHLILAQRLLGMQQTEILKSFDIAIQLGAILAVVLIYGRSIKRTPKAWLPIFVAFLPTAVIGFLLHTIVKTYLLGNSSVVVWALFIGGLFIVLFELLYKKETGAIRSLEAIPLKTAFAIGLCQSLALVPGVSRSAATIFGGMLLGIERRTIVDFSFLLAIPTMAAATGLDLLKSAHLFSTHDAEMLGIGFLVSFVTAYIVIRWLLKFVQTHTFTVFGYERIIVAIVFWV
ncbi:undecaprenyl-diphosphatase UppP [Candidatus Peribacteria bacterium]|nr:undecaprenyl-diphosphatase UppP [Candidatus Peribacteria bacterium]